MPHTAKIQEIIATLRAQDIDGLMQHIADDIVYEPMTSDGAGPSVPRATTKHDVRHVITTFQTLIETLEYTTIDVLSEDNRAASRHRSRVKIRATGRVIDLRTAFFWSFRDGLVTNVVHHFDAALIARAIDETELT